MQNIELPMHRAQLETGRELKLISSNRQPDSPPAEPAMARKRAITLIC
jgi:hypothetical protein